MTLFICTEDCFPWGLNYGRREGERQQRAYDLTQDLARELELDPFEETAIEYAPIDWAES